MPLLTYLSSDFEYQHEREMFQSIYNIISDKYDKEKYALLIGNLNINGIELDGLFIKENAIIILEFKNYSGKLKCYENGSWMIDDSRVVMGGSGNKNPFQQLRQNRYSVIDRFSQEFANFDIDFGHISGIVIFNGDIEIVENGIPSNIKPWFKISDRNNICDYLTFTIGSNKINLDYQNLNEIVNVLNLSGREFGKTNIQRNSEYKNVIKESIPINNDVKEILSKLKFDIIYNKLIPEKKAKYKTAVDLGLSQYSLNYLNPIKQQLYVHQHKGIKLAKENKNICMNTSTGSGKSLVFYVSAIELLSRNKNAKIIAIYPQKALGFQQEQKWKESIKLAKIDDVCVNRIDGDVPKNSRPDLLQKSNVIIMTPDVVHSWLLNEIETNKNSIEKINMIIVDEVHNYKGVFGTNSAFLFRRLNHAIKSLDKDFPQYITASATISDPVEFHNRLFGLEYSIIDNSFDSSPKYNSEIILANPSNMKNLYNDMVQLTQKIYNETNHQFIEFVDSRKMTEQLSVAINRDIYNEQEVEHTNLNGVLPYRSGFLAEDSQAIFQSLQNNQLRGVVSTSSLEIGIDIGDLSLGILWGVPYSSTSLYQRIGRFGRKKNSTIIIINDGSPSSSYVFNKPERIQNLPILENKLYLENEMIQYIHSFCFTNQNLKGEYDSTLQNPNDNEANRIIIKSDFPENFENKCINIRTSQNIKNHYYQKVEGFINDNRPHYVFPLRDVEPQFKLYSRLGREEKNIGYISYNQLLREAYPGAIYYHGTIPYRVSKIITDGNERRVLLNHQRKRYTTKPINLPNVILPDFQNILFRIRKDNLIMFESDLTIIERIKGFHEIQGNQKNECLYPNKYFRRDKFQRRYITTGIIIHHPVLDELNSINIFAKILFEAFLINVPVDKQDIGYGANKFILENNIIDKNNSFFSIYDNTYGSLRLTSKLNDMKLFKKILKTAEEIIDNPNNIIIDQITTDQPNINMNGYKNAIHEIAQSLDSADSGFDISNNMTKEIFNINSKVIYNDEEWQITAHNFKDNISSYNISKIIEKNGRPLIKSKDKIFEYELKPCNDSDLVIYDIKNDEIIDE